MTVETEAPVTYQDTRFTDETGDLVEETLGPADGQGVAGEPRERPGCVVRRWSG